MARINIDEKWLSKDPRRKKFVKAVGDEDKADGLALRFWVLGQEAYSSGKLVNKKQFYMLPYAKEFLSCELAEERDGGIYIKGSKRRMEWYRKMIAGAAKGGAQKSTAKAQAAKKREEAKRHKKTETEELQELKHKPPQALPTNHKPSQASYSYSSSYSYSNSDSGSESDSRKKENIATEVAHPPHPLLEVWNSHRGNLPKAKSCVGARLKKAKERWREQSPEEWIGTVKRLAESNFCNGKNDRGWRADFDFLLKPETWAKANEGKYDNHKGAISTNKTRTYDKLDELKQKWNAEV